MKHAVRNPRTGMADYEFVQADSAHLQARCAALKSAQAGWAAKSAAARAEVLMQWHSALTSRQAALTDALIADTGRRAVSMIEVGGFLGSLARWCAQAPALMAAAQGGDVQTIYPTIRTRTTLSPLGLVAVIAPWNFPLTLAMIDAVPALLSGCAVIIKPSEITPRFAGPLRASIADVPKLSAVLDIIDGDGVAGSAIIDVADAVCFTGSVPTGRKVAVQAAQNFIPAFLELGGKDPAIVLESADVDAATTALLRGSIVNTGQACQSIERIYVDASIYLQFVKQLVDKAQAVTLNADDIHHGSLGPIIHAPQADIIAGQIADAVARGAQIRSGGTIENHGGGLYLRPTVITGVTHDMAIMRDETFGPVLPVMAFDTVAQAVALANDSHYGLSAAVFAATLEDAATVGVQLDVGAVSLNDAALTSMVWEAEKSAFKLSGLGASRMGASGLLRFLRKRALIAQSGAAAPIDAFAEDRIG